jgi:transposase-like protein
MATRQQFKQSGSERRRRHFSEEFKQKKVREIEQKSTTIAEVSRQYDVRQNNVSRWMAKYGKNYMKGASSL